MANQLYASVSGCSSLESITVSDSHTAPTASATVVCLSSSLDVGDSISIDLGYSSSHERVFSGYVKNVVRSQSPTKYEITCANEMVRAIDYFIVSENPLTPYSEENIKAEDLVGDLMAMAGVKGYHGDNTSFTFATNGVPLEVNITSVYDFCKMVASVLAWHLYADDNGTVHFVNRPPFPDGDASVATINGSNAIDISYWRSDRDLRNRIVVYGSEGIFAEAKASSPYLPAGFYKSVLVAAPNLIGSMGMAQTTANYNLAALNRLTIGGSATIIGDSGIHCRDCVAVDRAGIGMSGQFYVFGIEHSWSQAGYTTSLELRQ
jgi:hypothetical protein